MSLVTDADGTFAKGVTAALRHGQRRADARHRRVELSAKLETAVSFDLSSLWVHDLAGPASSFKAMVTAGMEVERAAGLAGLMGAE